LWRLARSWPIQRSSLPPKQLAEYQVEFGGKISLAYIRCPGISADYKQATWWQPFLARPCHMTQPSADPISDDGDAYRAADHEADQRRSRLPLRNRQVNR
jgi:hypothetical protein